MVVTHEYIITWSTECGCIIQSYFHEIFAIRGIKLWIDIEEKRININKITMLYTRAHAHFVYIYWFKNIGDNRFFRRKKDVEHVTARSQVEKSGSHIFCRLVLFFTPRHQPGPNRLASSCRFSLLAASPLDHSEPDRRVLPAPSLM